MNRLLRDSFLHKGYTYEYLTDIFRDVYGQNYIFEDEGQLVLALKKIHDAGRHVVVYPDFDMDGISAGCILYAGLSLFGFRVSLFAPRTDRGYGMEPEDVERLVSEFPDASAVITCDVGIAAMDAIARARSHGLEVLVTDHHPETMRTSASVIVDPSRIGSQAEFKCVCGAYVALHVMRLYADLTGNEAVKALIEKLTLFAGLGSRGDAMPVIHDTRSVVRRSVELFNQLLDCEDVSEFFGCSVEMLPDVYVAPFENLRALHYYMLREGKVQGGDLTEETYDFKYCPLFNSIKRMGSDIRLLYDLLYTRYPWERNTEREDLCSWIVENNETRKAAIKQIYESLAQDASQAYAPYIYLADAKPGLLGPLASKFLELTGKPCLVLRPDGDGYSGSGRTPQGFDRTKNGAFTFPGVKADGHENAFGAHVPKKLLKDVRDAMERGFLAMPSGTGVPGEYYVLGMNGRQCLGDYDFSITRPDDFDVCFEYAHEIDRFRPFGQGLEEPEFALAFTPRDVLGSRVMGSSQTHLRLSLDHAITVVWFNGAGFLEKLSAARPEDVFRIAGKFRINRFNGSEYLQFQVDHEISC